MHVPDLVTLSACYLSLISVIGPAKRVLEWSFSSQRKRVTDILALISINGSTVNGVVVSNTAYAMIVRTLEHTSGANGVLIKRNASPVQGGNDVSILGPD